MPAQVLYGASKPLYHSSQVVRKIQRFDLEEEEGEMRISIHAGAGVRILVDDHQFFGPRRVPARATLPMLELSAYWDTEECQLGFATRVSCEASLTFIQSIDKIKVQL